MVSHLDVGTANSQRRQVKPRHRRNLGWFLNLFAAGQPDGKLRRTGILLLPSLALAGLILAALPAGFVAAGRADIPARKLVIALPDGLSPRTIGFYLAQSEGYFSDRNLIVDFVSSGNQPPSKLLADGKVDLAIDLMPIALRLHQSGSAIEHVAQFFQHSSLALYCRPPITKPTDLHGTTIGVWLGGEESSFYAWMSSLNISTFGEEDGVTVLRQGRVSEALADARLDCVTSTSYLAPQQMQASGITPNSRTIFRYEDLGVGTLEDGLYARSKDLQQDDRVDLFARFLAASNRGWQKLHDDRPSALRLFRLRSDSSAATPDKTTNNDKPAADKTTAGQTTTGNSNTANSKKRDASSKTAKADTGAKDQPPKDAATVVNGIEVSDKSGTTTGDSKSDGGLDPAALKASLDAVDALIDPTRHPLGLLDGDSYDRTVNLLLTGAPEPILKGAPVDAVSDRVWKRLRQDANPAKP